MQKMFSAKVDQRLINLVKANPVLYDFNDRKYMDFNTREVAWQKIGDELEKPGEFHSIPIFISYLFKRTEKSYLVQL